MLTQRDCGMTLSLHCGSVCGLRQIRHDTRQDREVKSSHKSNHASGCEVKSISSYIAADEDIKIEQPSAVEIRSVDELVEVNF